MDFNKLSDKDLLQAYRGYCKAAETGTVGEDDFDGIFYMAVDEREKKMQRVRNPRNDSGPFERNCPKMV